MVLSGIYGDIGRGRGRVCRGEGLSTQTRAPGHRTVNISRLGRSSSITLPLIGSPRSTCAVVSRPAQPSFSPPRRSLAVFSRLDAVPSDAYDKAPRTRASAAVLPPASRCADCYGLRHPSIPSICNSTTSTRFPPTSTQTSLPRLACNCRPRCPSRDVVSLGFPGALPDAVAPSHPGAEITRPKERVRNGGPSSTTPVLSVSSI